MGNCYIFCPKMRYLCALFFYTKQTMSTNYTEQAQAAGHIKIEEDRILYVHQGKKYNFSDPEEKVRCQAYLELIYEYGYTPQDIDFEVRAKQGGSGKTSADIVIYYPNEVPKKAFLVIEVKEGNTKTKEDEVRKQARSYARSEEINTPYFAYKIGDNPFKAFKINGKDTEVRIPYQYNKDTVYAYLVEGETTDEKQAHYIPIKPSTPHDLKRIFGQCHNIIWQSGEKNKQKSLDEFNKLLFLKMFDELEREKHEVHLEKYLFQTSPLETKSQLKSRIEQNYQQAIRDRKVEKLLKPIQLDAQQIYDIVEKLQPYSLIQTDKDPKGLAFETFVENYMKGDFGQYFTPRNIVEFILSVSPIVWEKSFDSSCTVLDPCCGSGSFLTQAISVFKNRYKKPKNWQEFANNAVFGVEIGEDISVSAKINLALHDDGHDNIKNANGLNIEKFDWKAKQFRLILTNPPFGGQPILNQSHESSKVLENLARFYDYEKFEITQKRPDIIDVKRKKAKDTPTFGDSIRPELIFIELFYKALQEEGMAYVIVPDGVLTNSTSQYVRDFITERFRLLAVISLPQYTFTHYGAGVKASIIVLKKYKYTTTQRIQLATNKYLDAAIKQQESKLTALETQKANLQAEYESIIAIMQQLADEKKVTLEAAMFQSEAFAKKELAHLEKEAQKKIKEIVATDAYKAWKKEREADINDRINAIKEVIYDTAQQDFNKYEKEFDFPIFMAIAEQIGYDATGRTTAQNDLLDIAPELVRFLEQQANTPDSFFA